MQGKALVRRPSGRVAEGIVTHLERTPVDAERAVRQWEGYVAALRENGWETVEVPPEEEAPDGVFVEDAVVVYRDVALLARSGAEERRREVPGCEAVVRELGYEVRRVEEPGTLDGGDVLKVGDTVYVGQGGRTNAEGLRQLRAAFEPAGAQVFGVPVTSVLHLKSAVTALPDGTVIGYPEAVDAPSAFPRFRGVPEPEGAHVVLLGGSRLLMSAGAPRSAELFAEMGYQPVPVDIGEFEKLEGCVTCLSVRLREVGP
ncbi:N(G),N(G)-dimethylarginine dimethylaminohydrolase [Streptomyces sp. DSM 42041]|uniref:N(G),N(G)-dimethylarginine dimethylaminohydrolase n=1 Tax=Streptomyces hazeniae TaxID=3075538 RepID=A0ABU2NQI1_9ACTN|nr:dimethylargininase [Streptomyces sp. DSM 42041]MDT0378861.1 N(G),N(G)-dimethylarginine dimethylaminohydrolase [Streptomyces sp. DSM 42041]